MPSPVLCGGLQLPCTGPDRKLSTISGDHSNPPQASTTARAATAGARLRDERKARETEKQRAEAMQERAAQLQQKLDALTDLEKSLSDRSTPTR